MQYFLLTIIINFNLLRKITKQKGVVMLHIFKKRDF